MYPGPGILQRKRKKKLGLLSFQKGFISGLGQVIRIMKLRYCGFTRPYAISRDRYVIVLCKIR